MRFSGRIRFGDVQDADLDVVVEVTDTHVRLVSGHESLGSWCLADVFATRVVANEFQMDLHGESVTFLADDQVNFAYGAVQKMAEGWARYHAMNLVRRKRAVGSARRANEPNRVETVRRAFVTAGGDLQRSVSVEAPEPPPQATFEQPAAREADLRLEQEPFEEEPVAPTVEDISKRDETTALPAAREGFWDRVERATAAEEAPTPDRTPPRHTPSPIEAGRLPRLNAFPRRGVAPNAPAAEVEVVTAEVVSGEPEPVAPPAVPEDREEPVVEAATEAIVEVAPDPEPVVDTPSLKPDPEAIVEVAPDPEPIAPEEPDPEPIAPEEPEERSDPPQQETGEVTNGHRFPATTQPVAVSSYRDGHHPSETTGLRASLRSIFSRSNGPHEHSFVESTTAVGITRRVCLECGHVSIGVSE